MINVYDVCVCVCRSHFAKRTGWERLLHKPLSNHNKDPISLSVFWLLTVFLFIRTHSLPHVIPARQTFSVPIRLLSLCTRARVVDRRGVHFHSPAIRILVYIILFGDQAYSILNMNTLFHSNLTKILCLHRQTANLSLFPPFAHHQDRYIGKDTRTAHRPTRLEGQRHKNEAHARTKHDLWMSLYWRVRGCEPRVTVSASVRTLSVTICYCHLTIYSSWNNIRLCFTAQLTHGSQFIFIYICSRI